MTRSGPKAPWKLTPELMDSILRDISRGLFVSAICEYEGITEDAFYKACQRDPDFYRRVREALQEGETSSAERVRNGAPGWQGAALYLAKRHPKRWGKMVDEHAPVAQPVKIIVRRKKKKRVDDPQGSPEPSPTPTPIREDEGP